MAAYPRPFKNRPLKCPDFELFQFSNGWISDPYCIAEKRALETKVATRIIQMVKVVGKCSVFELTSSSRDLDHLKTGHSGTVFMPLLKIWSKMNK